MTTAVVSNSIPILVLATINITSSTSAPSSFITTTSSTPSNIALFITAASNPPTASSSPSAITRRRISSSAKDSIGIGIGIALGDLIVTATFAVHQFYSCLLKKSPTSPGDTEVDANALGFPGSRSGHKRHGSGVSELEAVETRQMSGMAMKANTPEIGTGDENAGALDGSGEGGMGGYGKGGVRWGYGSYEIDGREVGGG
ncbi:hypothetical protein K432DRAFT_389918 [Lepidopterella palustris CBS 459.81]|uniref:Uncharacterized protein n=1 Tax=Lepidopterella palustris CBS 459.81 TaxID=1314670 RepID=A0A8E2JIJ6_9PEZI|nr:hypothetical protein K432DRAFT_389918 [Lepidopterella palustris CBS 459.81]